MRITRKSVTLPIALTAVFGLTATACGSDSNEGSASSTTAASGADATTTTGAATGLDIDYASLTGTLNGSGSSFQDSLQQTIIGELAEVAPGLTVNYAKSGSSAGKADLAGNTVQFAGTDSLIKDEEQAKMAGDVLYIPIAAAPITISYNLPEVEELNLSADLIAKIFQTEVTTWNDPAIAAENPDAELPDATIAVVHRSDGSGTTNNFTKYLKKAAPEAWKLGSGDSVEWSPATMGAEKSSGVSSLIASTPGAVGYVDLADSVSTKLQRALVKNSAGNYIEPLLPNTSAALDGAEIAEDLTYDPLNAGGEETYPITAPTWVLVYVKQPSQEVVDNLKGYLTYFLTEGQKIAPTVGYAALPAALQEKALAQLDKITVG